MKKAIKSHFVKPELASLAQSFIGFLSALVIVVDSLPQLQTVLNGNWSWVAIVALLGAIAKSAVKLLWNMAKDASKKIPADLPKR